MWVGLVLLEVSFLYLQREELYQNGLTLGYMQGVWSGTAARTQEDTFASVVGGTEILSMDTHREVKVGE